MISSKIVNSKIQFFFYFAAILFITFAIIGGIRRYTPVPFGDMWDGYVGWYIQDPLRGLWDLHNEHRIVLARLIYWLDVNLFGNQVWFLIAVNYLLVAGACLVFWLILKEQANHVEQDYVSRIFFSFLVAWLFAWSQRDNFAWGFQNQFFNAQLLPLCALYLLYRSSIEKSKSRLTFFWSCLVGVLSCGTMANGVLILPIMTGYAFLIRQSWKRILILVFLGGGLLFLYFLNFRTPERHSSVNSLFHFPWMIIEYSLLYLGNPFYAIVRKFGLSYPEMLMLVASVGYWLIISVLYFTIKYLFFLLKKIKLFFSFIFINPPVDFNHETLKRQLMLIAFICFIILSSLGTASGRIIFGIDSALTSRYATPAIMAWAALYMLYFPYINTAFKKYGNIVWLPFMIILLLLLPDEWTALKNKNKLIFNSHLAVLALELHVPDKEIIEKVMYMDRAFARLEQADKKKFVISGMEKFKGIRQRMGQIGATGGVSTQCLGEIESATVFNKKSNFVRVSGWMTGVDKNKNYQPVQFLDSNHRVIGFALTGKPPTKNSQDEDHQIRFEGYLQNHAGQQIIVANNKFSCHIHSFINKEKVT